MCFSGAGQAAVATSGAAALDRRISACDGGRYAGCLHPCAVPPKQFFLVNFLERRVTGVIRIEVRTHQSPRLKPMCLCSVIGARELEM